VGNPHTLGPRKGWKEDIVGDDKPTALLLLTNTSTVDGSTVGKELEEWAKDGSSAGLLFSTLTVFDKRSRKPRGFTFARYHTVEASISSYDILMEAQPFPQPAYTFHRTLK
jgi:hypothetical protein